MLGLCIGLIGGLALERLDTDHFTLAWTHSVERTGWEEDYRVGAAGLALVEARIRGSGAGMEPPDGARLVDGWWVYAPALGPLPAINLANSAFGGAYRLCTDAGCRGLPAGAVALTVCP